MKIVLHPVCFNTSQFCMLWSEPFPETKAPLQFIHVCIDNMQPWNGFFKINYLIPGKYFKLTKDCNRMSLSLPFQDLEGVIILWVWVWSRSLDWVSGSLQVWSGYTEYTGSSERRVRGRMRWRAWWKRFILGWDLITCIHSYLHRAQPRLCRCCVPFSFFFPLTPLS